jgi:hypothetical protein
MSLRTETGNTERIIGASFVLFITFLPRIFFFLPAVFLVRWVVNVWEKETLYASYPLHRRIRRVLLLVFVGLASAILLEALVSFLRLGVQPPTTPWGDMLRVLNLLCNVEPGGCGSSLAYL